MKKIKLVKKEFIRKNGALMIYTPFLNGKKHGIELIKSVKRSQKMLYFCGDFLGFLPNVKATKSYHFYSLDNKKLSFNEVFLKGITTCILRRFYDTGQLRSEIPYVNGIIHGTKTHYLPNGQIKFQTKFDNGKWQKYKYTNFHL